MAFRSFRLIAPSSGEMVAADATSTTRTAASTRTLDTVLEIRVCINPSSEG
jgi:hypothetical protein